MIQVLFLSAFLLPADPSKDEIASFKNYLEKNHKGKKWQLGPSGLESKELTQAYPGQHFYYVYSSPPLPPGAALPELLERHRRAAEDFSVNYISVTVAMGKDGIRTMGKVESFREGLMVVKSEDDAKVAAAAVLSLYPGRGFATGPAIIKAGEVKVLKTEKGWTCSAQKQFSFQGTVEFDAEGKLLSVSKNSIAPLPPSAPPRPR